MLLCIIFPKPVFPLFFHGLFLLVLIPDSAYINNIYILYNKATCRSILKIKYRLTINFEIIKKGGAIFLLKLSNSLKNKKKSPSSLSPGIGIYHVKEISTADQLTVLMFVSILRTETGRPGTKAISGFSLIRLIQCSLPSGFQ